MLKKIRAWVRNLHAEQERTFSCWFCSTKIKAKPGFVECPKCRAKFVAETVSDDELNIRIEQKPTPTESQLRFLAKQRQRNNKIIWG